MSFLKPFVKEHKNESIYEWSYNLVFIVRKCMYTFIICCQECLILIIDLLRHTISLKEAYYIPRLLHHRAVHCNTLENGWKQKD